jgi:DNA-binding HxlR family transcriptional regulator
MDKIDTMGFLQIKRLHDLNGKQAEGQARQVMASRKSTMPCGCPVMAFQKLISGKYKIRILWDLKDGPLRYGEVRRGLLRGGDASEEITPRVLSRELKALVAGGLITRKDFAVVPPKVEYRLTRSGQSFIPVIDMIRKWGTRHLRVAEERSAFGVAAE